MSAIQPNAQQFNPNQLNLVHVATYEREIGVPLVRVWENVLDWEHLPWLHRTSFDYVELDAGGDWGWRTWSDPEHLSHVELTRADQHRYVARSYRAGTQASEIWTELTDFGDTTGVSVTFHIADVTEAASDNVGAAMIRLYTRLWDEDEAMMQERHRRLHEDRALATEVDLGEYDSLQQAVQQGERVVFQLQRREYQLAPDRDELTCHSTICPHLLGPLQTGSEPGELFCAWHGYRFNRDTGDCTFPAEATCRLSSPPDLTIENGRLIARSAR